MKQSHEYRPHTHPSARSVAGLATVALILLLMSSLSRTLGAPPQSSARTIDLGQNGSALLTVYGGHADDTHVLFQNVDRYAQALATGDVNGDGIPDVLIGAPFAKGPDGKRANAGEVYIIFGRSDGSLNGSRDLAAPLAPAGSGPDVIIFGSAGASIGGAILAQDMNADGIDDILLGSPILSPASNQTFFGGVLIYFGSTDLTPGTRLDLAGQVARRPDITYGGSSFLSAAGTTLAGGDVNGDRIPDLLVGAPLWNKGSKQQVGAAYLFLGAQGLSGNRSMAAAPGSPSGPYASFAGADASDIFSQALAVGDVNGDGVGDLVIGASGGDGPGNGRKDAGEAYVFFGGSSLPAGSRDVSTSAPDLLVYGATANDSLGVPLLIYDFNGDGSNDLLIGGARDATLPSPTTGAVHVIFGGQGLTSGTVRDLATELTPEGNGADAKVVGPGANVGFPSSMTAGDLDGDGRWDLAIGAQTMPKPGAAAAGAAFILLGKSNLPGGFVLNLASTEPGKGADVVVSGVAAQDQTAYNVAAADVNKDGTAELILSAPGADGPGGSRPNSGAVYVASLAGR